MNKSKGMFPPMNKKSLKHMAWMDKNEKIKFYKKNCGMNESSDIKKND